MDFSALKSWAASGGHTTKRRSYENLYADLLNAGAAIPAEFPCPKRFRAEDNENNAPREPAPPKPAADQWLVRTVATIQTSLLEQTSTLRRQEQAHDELKAEVLALKAETTKKEQAHDELKAEVLALKAETTEKEKVLADHTSALEEMNGHLKNVARVLMDMNPLGERHLYKVKESTATVESMKSWRAPATKMKRKLAGIKWDNMPKVPKKDDVVKVVVTTEAALYAFEAAAKTVGIILEKKPNEQDGEWNGSASASSTQI